MKKTIDKKALLEKNVKAKEVFEKITEQMKDIQIEKTNYRLGNPFGSKKMYPLEEDSDWEQPITKSNYVEIRRY